MGSGEATRKFLASFRNAVPAVHDAGRDLFDARQLHAWLGVATPFNDWIARRLSQYGFEVGVDCYAKVRGKGGRGGSNRVDYLITRDMAKELAMVERTDRGRLTRRSWGGEFSP